MPWLGNLASSKKDRSSSEKSRSLVLLCFNNYLTQLTCVSNNLDNTNTMLVALEDLDAFFKLIHPGSDAEVSAGGVEHFWRNYYLEDHSRMSFKCLKQFHYALFQFFYIRRALIFVLP